MFEEIEFRVRLDVSEYAYSSEMVMRNNIMKELKRLFNGTNRDGYRIVDILTISAMGYTEFSIRDNTSKKEKMVKFVARAFRVVPFQLLTSCKIVRKEKTDITLEKMIEGNKITCTISSILGLVKEDDLLIINELTKIGDDIDLLCTDSYHAPYAGNKFSAYCIPLKAYFLGVNCKLPIKIDEKHYSSQMKRLEIKTPVMKELKKMFLAQNKIKKLIDYNHLSSKKDKKCITPYPFGKCYISSYDKTKPTLSQSETGNYLLSTLKRHIDYIYEISKRYKTTSELKKDKKLWKIYNL